MKLPWNTLFNIFYLMFRKWAVIWASLKLLGPCLLTAIPPPWSSEIFVVGCFSLWPSSNTEAFNKFIVRNYPINNQNSYISRTECPIYFIPGCKFKFIRCLQTYLRKLIIHFGQWRDPTGPFFIKDPLKLASQDALGSMTVKLHNDQKSVLT